MYRDGSVYDAIDKVIIDIFLDYDIKEFPIDEVRVCKKMGVELVPYSELSKRPIRFLEEKRKYAFFVRESKEQPPTIYYNDRERTIEEIRFSIFHELKHYVFDDEDDEEDDLAEHFARYFMCPTPYIMLKDFDFPEEIEDFFKISYTAAKYAYSQISKRIKRYQKNLFDYEIALVEHLDPLLLEPVDHKFIKTKRRKVR